GHPRRFRGGYHRGRVGPLPAEGRVMEAADAKPSARDEEKAPASGTSGAESAKPSRRKKEKETAAALRLRRLTKRFGAKTAVDDLPLTIAVGSVYGLIGPNGAGKTTTFSMIAGFLRPTEGSVEVLGHAPTDVDDLRSRVGVLPQDAILPPSDRVGELLV